MVKKGKGAAHQDMDWIEVIGACFQCLGDWSKRISHLQSKWRTQGKHIQGNENKNPTGAVAQWAAHLPSVHGALIPSPQHTNQARWAAHCPSTWETEGEGKEFRVTHRYESTMRPALGTGDAISNEKQ